MIRPRRNFKHTNATNISHLLCNYFPGIGIDDMFVIVQCLTNLRSEAEASKWGLDRRVGEALKHAGVSITVTSATDVVAFGVGAVTVSSRHCLFLYYSSPEALIVSKTRFIICFELKSNFVV